MNKKKFLNKLSLLNDGGSILNLVSRLYAELIQHKYNKYVRPKREDIKKLVEFCKDNGWNPVEYLRFQVQYCNSKNISCKMLISDRAKQLWENREDYTKPQLKTNKGIMYDTCKQSAYFLKLLKQKHGNKVWIEKYFGEKSKYNIDAEIIQYEGDIE